MKNNLFMHVVKGGPAGGGYSTVEDLFRFSKALLGHELMSRDYTKQMISAKVNTDSGNRNYGYGIRTLTENGQRVIGHSGGFPGINSFLDMYIDLGYTVAVMSNYDNGATEVREFIMAQMIGKTRWMIDRELTREILDQITKNGFDAGVALYEQKKGEGDGSGGASQ